MIDLPLRKLASAPCGSWRRLCTASFCLAVALIAPATDATTLSALSANDTIVRQKHWLNDLTKGKIDPTDTTTHYPRFVKFCLRTVKWYKREFNTYDTLYVGNFNYKWRVMLRNFNWAERYECTPFSGYRMSFNSGAASSLGFFVSFRGIGAGYSVDVDRLVGDRPTSNRWQIGITTSRFTAEAFIMSNRGKMSFTIRDQETGQSIRENGFTGIHRNSWGVSGYYVFNHLRYGQAAVYGYSKRQLRSAGSWLLGFNVTHQKFKFVGKEVNEIYKDDPTDDEDETAFDYTDFCVSGGYGYNWALGSKWVLNGTVLLYTGPKHAHTISNYDGGHTFFGINGKVRGAITYTGNRFFAGLQGYVDSKYYNTGSYRYRNYIFDLTAIVGVRF